MYVAGFRVLLSKLQKQRPYLSEALARHIETKEVAIYSFATHSITIESLVDITSLPQKVNLLLIAHVRVYHSPEEKDSNMEI